MLPCKYCLQLQGSKPKLPYEVLEHAYAQEQLKKAQLERADRELQAKLERTQAIQHKVHCICSKGAAKAREVSSRARLLQTKFDNQSNFICRSLARLNSEANADLLQMTVEEKEKRLHYNLQEAEDYKQKMLHTQVCCYSTDPP